MDINKNQQTAEQLFATHPDKNIVYFTADGFAFFEKQNADGHATSLTDKSLDAHARPEGQLRSILDNTEGGDEGTATKKTTSKK